MWPNRVKMISKQLIGRSNISDHSHVGVTDEIKSDSLYWSKKDESRLSVKVHCNE